MPYSELIKRYEKTREYMRRFYVYGFWHREQFQMKSARSYDNERRRVESWLADYVSFRQDESGKAVFLSVDGRNVRHNPLYQVFKAKSFTANDITLHFYLMDILEDDEELTIKEILDIMTEEYFSEFGQVYAIDESTLRKKLKEYVKLGLVEQAKDGRNILYRRVKSVVDLDSWADILAFYSETDPMGVAGSFLLDKISNIPEYYQFKHHFLLFALDSEVLCSILFAMSDGWDIKLKMQNGQGKNSEFIVRPVKIYVSTQNGRQYLLAWDDADDRPRFYRLDHILAAEPLEPEHPVEKEELIHDNGNGKGEENKDAGMENRDIDKCSEIYERKFEEIKNHLWGVSFGDYENLEHLEMTVFVEPWEDFIVQRLEREKRGGNVERLDDHLYKFSIDVYSTKEMLPWLRTFIGRIMDLKCSNAEVQKRFYEDMQTMYEMYGGERDAVQ